MIFLPLFLLLRCTTALPSTVAPPPTPSITHTAYGSPWYDVSCLDNGNAVVEILPLHSASGSYEMKYTLKEYSPWMDVERAVLRKYCKLNLTIDIPEGWKVEVDKGGGTVDGYMALPENATGTFLANYIFESTGTYSATNITFRGPVGKFERQTAVTHGPAVSNCGADILQTKLLVSGNSNDGVTPETPVEGYRWVVTSPLRVLQCDEGF